MKQTLKLAWSVCFALLACVLMFTACNSGNETRTPSNATDETTDSHIHTFGEWITILNAKCEEEGLSQRYCSECNYTESKSINASGHDSVKHEGRAPICCLAGFEPYETCTRCDYATEKKELPALEHSYDSNGFCTICHDSEKFKIFECFNDDYNYEVVIGYKSTECFIGIETLIIPAYHNGKRISHIGGDYNFAGMGEFTFRGLKDLKTLIISEGIEEVIWQYFFGCRQVASITIPQSMKKLYTDPFFVFPNLKEITYGGTKEQWLAMLPAPRIPSTVTVHCTDGDILIEKATESSDGLEMKLKDDGTYECIGIGTCTDRNLFITNYNGVPVTSIADSAFFDGEESHYNNKFLYIAFGSSVTSIGDKAIKNGGCLYGVYIENSLVNIGKQAFSRCSLMFLQFAGTMEQWNAIENETGWIANCIIYCTDGNIEK